MNQRTPGENSGESLHLKNQSVAQYYFIFTLTKRRYKGICEDVSNHKKNYELTGQQDWKTGCELSVFFLFKALAFYPSCRQLHVFVLDRFFDKDIVDWRHHTIFFIFKVHALHPHHFEVVLLSSRMLQVLITSLLLYSVWDQNKYTTSVNAFLRGQEGFLLVITNDGDQSQPGAHSDPELWSFTILSNIWAWEWVALMASDYISGIWQEKGVEDKKQEGEGNV